MAPKPQLHTGIYIIENLLNGRRYVGSAMRFSKRWKEHLRGLERGNHHSRFLQREWVKRGAEAFSFRVALFCTPDDLLFYEQALIDFYKPEYNTAPVAGSQLGFRHSAESRAKMSASNSRIGNPGYNHTSETKAAISAKKAGVKHGRYSEARRAAISVALKGKPVSDERRARISATLKGHKQSAERVAKRVCNTNYSAISKALMRLSDPEVLQIRDLFAVLSARQIAKYYGVSRGTIDNLKHGRFYAEVV